ncbi:MAG TPA: DUF6338 family protein [Candidatus Binataceae bacterium]|nr:DUF6338 family protein [Candidatus Binataceae bacterium]
MTEFALRIVFLFFPGILCALLVENLVPTRPWSDTRFALYSLVLGLGNYLVYAVVFGVTHSEWPPKIWFFRALTAGDPLDLNYLEIISVSGIALLIGMFVCVGLNKHWLQKFAQRIGVSSKFGDLDVWSHTFNSSDLTDRWVVVRDFARDLAYEGWVSAFSDTAVDNELLLREVVVYQSSTSLKLYDVESVYLSRKKDELTIEFRKGQNLGN